MVDVAEMAAQISADKAPHRPVLVEDTARCAKSYLPGATSRHTVS